MSTTPFYERSQRERKDVEQPAIDYAFKRGWWHMKVTSPTRKAMPDDLFVRNGEYLWIEFKAPGEVPTPQQLKRHRDMRKAGMDVRWTDDVNRAMDWLR
jgi:hypothetical protein